MATIIDPPNSVWPNGLKVDSEGYVTFYSLGSNKVDISTITWPDGDELISPFIYKNDKLVGFVDTEALTITDNTLIYLPYEHIETQFSAIDKGQLQIHAPKAITKKASWKDSVKEDIPEAQFKYKDCKTFNDVLRVDTNYSADIVDGVWSEPLWDLTNGEGMFSFIHGLRSFFSDLPSLTHGFYMFSNTGLSSFSSDLSSLTNGDAMFSGAGLMTFSSDLSSLTEGNNMFNSCKLDASSVKNIIDTINTYSGTLTLGMGCFNTTEDKDLFAQEVDYADMTSLLAALQAKGWTVTAQYNNRPPTTYGLRRPSEDTLPVFVKLEETEEHADYTSLDGSKNFRFDWFHETTGSTDGYTKFTSLEEAVEYFNIKPMKK